MSRPVSLVLSDDVATELEALVERSGRELTGHLQKAAADYVAGEREFHQAVARGIAVADAGQLVDQAEAMEILARAARSAVGQSAIVAISRAKELL